MIGRKLLKRQRFTYTNVTRARARDEQENLHDVKLLSSSVLASDNKSFEGTSIGMLLAEKKKKVLLSCNYDIRNKHHNIIIFIKTL